MQLLMETEVYQRA